MENVYVKDNHLYIEFESYVYPMGHQEIERIIPLDRINFIEENVGPRGGDHGWTIYGKEKWDTLFNSEVELRFKALAEFGRGRKELLKMTKQSVPHVEVKIKQEEN